MIALPTRGARGAEFVAFGRPITDLFLLVGKDCALQLRSDGSMILKSSIVGEGGRPSRTQNRQGRYETNRHLSLQQGFTIELQRTG